MRDAMGACAAPAAVALSLDRVVVEAGGFRLDAGPLRLACGDRLGLVGRNGCGKTTLLEAIAGLRRAAVLDGTLLGQPLAARMRRPLARRAVGVLLQQVNLSLYLTVAEVLDLYHATYGAGWPRLADALDIGQLLALRARTLSRGQRQRLDLYMALAHRPDLIMLDEPLAGLDRAYIELVAGVLRGPELAGAALLIVGHTDDEFALMDQVALVHGGGVDAPLPPALMVERHLARYRLGIDMASSADADQIEARARAHGQVRRVVRHSETGISAFSERLLAAGDIDPAAGRWLSCETGLTTLEHVIRFGPATGDRR